MSLVRVPPPRPNLWCCANFTLPEVFIIGSDGKQHCRTSKRTCRQNGEDTYEDIFGPSALALAGRRRCLTIEADEDTKARIFGECEISAPEEQRLPVLANLTGRNHRTNPCTWEQLSRKPCFNRTPLELKRMPEKEEERSSNANCNGCLKLPSVCSQIMSCRHSADKRRQCCGICHQCLPSLADATNCRCSRRTNADVYWLGDPKDPQCSCRVCGQTCLGRHALEFYETRCPPIELPNQLYWLGNPVCDAPSALQRGCGSSLASNESWPFGGFSRQPCRHTGGSDCSRPLQYCSATNSSVNSSRDSEPSRYQNTAEPGSSRYQNTAEPSRPFRASHDTMKTGSTSSKSSRYQPTSHTRTVVPSQTRAVVDTSRNPTNQSNTVIVTSSECDYSQPNCPNDKSDC